MSAPIPPALLWSVLWALVVFTIVALSTLVFVWLERKAAGNIQLRHGPMHTGWHGLLQLVADTLKMLGKEDVVPSRADRRLFVLAPYLVFLPAALTYVVLPIDAKHAIMDLNVGALYAVAVPGVSVIGLLVAGWASHNNFSLLGGLRSAAQMLSYEVPRSLAVLSVVFLAGTMSLGGVVRAQQATWYGPWFVLLLPLGFVVYLITSVAEVNRTPFDIPEAESELVGGYHTEYSGLRWSMFMMAEYGSVLAASVLGSVLFLGGGSGPGVGLVPAEWSWVVSLFWLTAKSFALVVFMIWMRWTLPRFRADQLMSICWKFFLPVALLNLAAAAALAIVLPTGVLPS